MLVDHHCHLDFPDFAADLDGVVGAGAGGRRRADGDDLDAHPALRPRSWASPRRYDNVFCSVGTHPHYAHEELDVPGRGDRAAGRGTPRWWRSARRGSTTSTTTARARRRPRASASTSPRRGQTQLPLVIHARDADEDTAAILEEEMAKGAFPAVLHCFTGGRGAGQARAGARALRLVLGHPDLQEVGRAARDRGRRAARPAAGRDRRALPGAGQVPRQAQRAGLRGADGGGAGQGEGRRRRRSWRSATTENFFRLYTKTPRDGGGRMSMRFTILGCGSSGGVPRVGNVWGACDPANPKNRRRRCALLVERFDKGGRTAVLVDTPPDMREQLLDARVETLDGVLFTHDHADHTHGIDDLRGIVLHACGGASTSTSMRTTREDPDQALRLLLRAAAGLVLSGDPGGARHPPARAGAHRGRRRADRGRADRAGARRHHLAGVPLRQRGLFARHQRRAGGVAAAAAGARPVDRRCAAADAASEPFQREAGAAVDRAASAPSAPSSRT